MSTTTIKTKDAPADVDTQFLADTLGEKFTAIVGRVVPYRQRTRLGLFTEEIAPGCFTASLAVNHRVPLLWSHDRDTLPIGVAEAWQERRDGLWARFRVAGNAFAQTVAAEVRDEMILGLSVGFANEVDEWKHPTEYDPSRGHLDHVIRKQARLFEVSLTSTPAYVGAQVTKVEAVKLDESARTALRSAQFERAADRRLRASDEEYATREQERADLAALREQVRKDRRESELRRYRAMTDDLRKRRRA